jgi:hypothetical protein
MHPSDLTVFKLEAGSQFWYYELLPPYSENVPYCIE